MQKNLALIAKYFKKIYKPTNNNLRTSSKSRNKNVDMTPRQSGQFRNQRMVNVAGAKENVGSLVVQQSGIQCFNCKEFRHFAKECRKQKRYDWLADTDKEVDEQELEAHYSYMAKIQEVPTADSGTNSEPVEQVQINAGYNVFANDLQHSEQSESVKECDCLAQKLSKQTKYVSKKVHNELLQRFAKVEKHSISLEIDLQKCKEQVKLDTVCNKKASNGFRKECEQYIKIKDLKAKLQDKNVAISELRKRIEKARENL
nr:hypothetical protein [Tanacetum cinerariifolium]